MLTLDEIIDFCGFKECEVSLGDPGVGYLRIDGGGLKRPHNFNRYLSLNELASLPAPHQVLKKATLFRIVRGDEERRLNRDEFAEELAAFRRKVEL